MKDVIRAARLDKKMSQAELAAILGVTQVAISYWESGANLPPTKMLQPLADALEIPVERFFKKEGA